MLSGEKSLQVSPWFSSSSSARDAAVGRPVSGLVEAASLIVAQPAPAHTASSSTGELKIKLRSRDIRVCLVVGSAPWPTLPASALPVAELARVPPSGHPPEVWRLPLQAFYASMPKYSCI